MSKKNFLLTQYNTATLVIKVGFEKIERPRSSAE